MPDTLITLCVQLEEWNELKSEAERKITRGDSKHMKINFNKDDKLLTG